MSHSFDARTRPFEVPASVAELDGPSAAGVVELPPHLVWSGDRRYDLDDPHDRRRVYEIVLREGSLADQRRYVDREELVRVFDELFLPAPIQAAWRALFAHQVV
ncbi:MAG: hypothetical protein WD378_03665 [Egicoccus sp.]